MRNYLVLTIILLGIIFGGSFFSSSEGLQIPTWIKNTAGWWASDDISESEFLSAIEYLVTNKIITVSVFDNLPIRDLYTIPDERSKGYAEISGNFEIKHEGPLTLTIVKPDGSSQELTTISRDGNFVTTMELTSDSLLGNYKVFAEIKGEQVFVSSFDVKGASSESVPGWIKNTAGWWAEDQVSDNEFINGITWLIENHVITLDKDSQQNEITEYNSPSNCNSAYPTVCIPTPPPDLDCHDIPYTDFKVLPPDPHNFDGGGDGIGCEYTPIETSQDCLGEARCFSGTVTKIVDGDTINVDGESIRFALAMAAELDEYGGIDAREFVSLLCPVGSIVLVDEDDGQTEGSHDRLIGVIHCNGINLNEAVIEEGHALLGSGFCSISEFSEENWAQKYGCSEKNCDPSYPDFCIPSPPPDLDCRDIPQKGFTVLQPDPHRFDGDNDGFGC